ncbi:hypothetical protein KEJ36_05305, partial [Candidatus Bathyarchaeota archaeon]|nr:hypothetical protein [Candidatus Bathyarchaeota archaeon]
MAAKEVVGMARKMARIVKRLKEARLLNILPALNLGNDIVLRFRDIDPCFSVNSPLLKKALVFIG